ncbi:helix-turn-helix transcriptional regulator [Paenibacillus sp. YPG26]|uniref:PadR family transcriptional regulator n=1 Tax=Paenibacillus sp. YPG26 TaxID=2878915 RepID=UPI002040C1AA|nr:helix-turn-helix transcriptional regulator [Paenibacillus sp. YPG26]USB34156.1 PadR family transcriptional regulator [Paenibacillus sp. YPG26]
MLEYVIMGLLIEQPMNGYEIKKTIDSSVGLFYKVSYGSLYPALKRLAEKGWISLTDTEDAKNKKIASLLPEGHRQFLLWLAEPLDLFRDEPLLRLFFYDHLDPAVREERLAEYRFALHKQVKQLEKVQSIVSKELEELENPEAHYYRVSMLHYGLKYLNMKEQWINDIKERNDL